MVKDRGELLSLMMQGSALSAKRHFYKPAFTRSDFLVTYMDVVKQKNPNNNKQYTPIVP